MIQGDTVVVDLCQTPLGIIYDDGGESASYSNNFDGWVVLRGAGVSEVSLTGRYDTEPYYDTLGIRVDGALISSNMNGSDSVALLVQGEEIVIHFHSDGSSVRSGFAIAFELVDGAGNLCTDGVDNLTASEINTHSTMLTWTGPAGLYHVVLNGREVGTTNGNNYSLNGLAANVYHRATVYLDGEQNRCCAGRVAWRTACGTMRMPLEETFDDMATDSVPTCWSRLSNFDDEASRPRVVALTQTNKALMLSCGDNNAGGHFALMASPKLATGESYWRIRFRYKGSHPGARMEVGLCDSVSADYDQYGFTVIETLTVAQADEWEEYDQTTSIPSGMCRLAFRMTQADQNGVGRRIHIDGIEASTCGVEEVRTQRTDTTSTELYWNTYGGALADVGVRIAGVLADDTVYTDCTSPLLITGLQPDTRYTLTIYPTCTGGGGAARSVTVRTAATHRIQRLCADLDGSSAEGWTMLRQNYSTNAGNQVGDIHTGNILVSPAVEHLGGKLLTFKHWTSYSGMRLVVGTMTYADDASSFVAFDTIMPIENFAQYRTVKVPDNAPGQHLALHAANGTPDYYCLHVRNLTLNQRGATNPRIVNTYGTQVEMAWDSLAGTGSIVIEYVEADTYPPSISRRDTVTGRGPGRHMVGGLTPHTRYTFTLLPLGDDDPCSLTTFEVNTAFRDYPLPYCEDFSTPVGSGWWGWWEGDWDRMYITDEYPQVSHQPFFYMANESVVLGSYGFEWGYNSAAALPNVEIDSGAYLSFYATDISTSGILVLGTIPAGMPTSIFHPFDTIALRGGGNREHYVYALPDSLAHLEQDRRLAMVYRHSDEYRLLRCYIDELHIAHSAYDALRTLYVGTDSAAFSYSMVGMADSLELTLMSSDTTIVDTIAATQIAPISIGGLSPGTLYRCFVRLLDNEEGCLSYTGYIITRIPGRYRTCFTFGDLLSYELPEHWTFSGNAWIDGEYLYLDSDSTWSALMPHLGELDGQHLSLRIANRDTVLIGLYLDSTLTDSTLHFHYDASMMVVLDTLAPGEMRYHTLPFDVDDTVPYRVAFMGHDTCWIDFAGVSGCPIVEFEAEGSTIICSVPDGRGVDYMLTYWQQGSSVSHTLRVVDNPFRLTGLQLGGVYGLTWRCINDANECTPMLEVHLADSLSLPYCEDFNPAVNGTGVPFNWTFLGQSNDNFIHIDPGSHNLAFGHWSPTQWDYAILPVLAQDTNLTVTLRMGFPGQSLFEVGTIDADGDTSTFASLMSSQHNQWSTHTLSVSSLRGRRLALRTHVQVYIESISIHAFPMAHYTVSNSTTLAVSTEARGDYYLRLERTWPSYHTQTVHVTPEMDGHMFDHLTYGDYTIYQQSSTDDPCPPYLNFTLNNPAPLPLCEDFDSYFGYYWTLPTGYYALGEDNHVNFSLVDYSEGNEVLRFDAGGWRRDYAVLPEPLTDSLRHLSLRLRYLAEDPADSIDVGILSNLLDTSSYTPIDTLSYAGGDWVETIIDLAPYTGSGRWIALRHLGNPNNHSFYVDNLRLASCPDALAASVSLHRHNVVRIDSESRQHAPFYAEYGPAGFAHGSGTQVLVDSLPYFLTLTPETAYDFHFLCNPSDEACETHTVKTLGAPLPIPSCIDFDALPHDVPHGWTSLRAPSTVGIHASHSGNQSLQVAVTVALPDMAVDSLQQMALGLWIMSPDDNSLLTVGTMSNPNNEATFHAIKSIAPTHAGEWEHHYVSFENAAPNAHFIALRNASGETKRIYVDDLHATDCAAFDMKVVLVSDNSISLRWKQVGQPDISLVFVDEGVRTDFPVQAGESYLSIGPITPTHNSQILFHAECPDGTHCAMAYDDTVNITPPGEGVGCVDVADLYSPQVVCFTGTYDYPYGDAGVVDFGPANANSRHTVCLDTAERDPRTGGLLRTIPQGATSSMRLGNWHTDPSFPQAEGVMYSLLVDTSNFDLLVMKYAAVLQDPLHAPEDQPRFRLELLDSAFNLIDPQCAAADFIANRNLGWNMAPSNVLWKDWTTVGIDLSAYAGRQVYVRLTTYDCNEGSHYGYAYFTLECMHRSIATEQCGDVDSIHFTAPAGFAYRWHQGGPTLGTSQSITVSTSGELYYCDLSFIDNPSCNFTMSAYAGTRYPLALFDTTSSSSDCPFRLQFHNFSTISADGINPVGSGEGCESAWWDFGNGQTSTAYHPTATYHQPGTYTVTLVVAIADGTCTDTLRRTFTLENHTRQPRLIGPSRLCAGTVDTLRLVDATTADPLWLDSIALPLPSACCDDITTTVVVQDAGGCTYTLHDTIVVRPVYAVEDTIVVCPTHRYLYEGVDYGGPTEFDSPHLTQHDCDSLVHVVLIPRDPTFRLEPILSLDHDEWHRYDTLLLGCAPTPLYLYDSTSSSSRHWTFWNTDGTSDTLHFDTQEALLQIDSAGTYAFQLTVSGIEGCSDTVRANPVLRTFPRPQAAFMWEPQRPSMHLPEVQLLNLSQPRDSLTYLWTITTASGTDTATAPSPYHRWQGAIAAGDYPVLLTAYLTHHIDDTTLLVCDDTVQHPITIADVYLQFPNLVTPNGDGTNDRWRIVNLLEQGEYTMNELWIYDHWGALVYHVRNIAQESDFWNPNDTSSPDGTYYFRFTAQNDYGLVRRNGIIEVSR